jgi:hypothetical protein
MTNETTGKVALLFLTMGDHAQPKIWNDFVARHSHQFNIYCHPYLPASNDLTTPDGMQLIAQTSFLYDHVIRQRAYTQWGYLTNVYYELLAAAIKIPDNKRFVFLSDTCVPIKGPDEIYAELMQRLDETFMDTPRAWQDKQRYRKRLGIERKHFFKHSGWFALCQADARKLVQSKKWFSALNTIQAGDEHILSILNQYSTSTLVHRPITYVRWDTDRHDLFRSGKLHRAHQDECDPQKIKQIGAELEKCKKANRHPVAWETRVTNTDLLEFLQSGCLFARKILPGCDVEVLMECQATDEQS